MTRDINSSSGLKISVDGKTVIGDGFEYESAQRATDVALEKARIQIKNDGFAADPFLNVVTKNNAVSAVRGEAISFYSFSNYDPFISRSEIRLFDARASVRSDAMAVVPIQKGEATFSETYDFFDNMIYVLRVYDKNGDFDETEPKPISFFDEALSKEDDFDEKASLSGYGLDRTAFRNINIQGAGITVYGQGAPAKSRVRIMGVEVPVDPSGSFIHEIILPYGDHAIDVDLSGGGRTAAFKRDIHIGNTDLFYVAIGDVTLGNQLGTAPTNIAGLPNDNVDLFGRGAMYLKGRLMGDYHVTASVNTGEDRLDKLFRNLDDKDPRQLLRRLDSDRFYPVYGDNSTVSDDTPTQGRFYVKVEKDDSHVMWGNFATQITGTEFAHLDRGLYGAIADYKSSGSTAAGDRTTQITAFAADPGTLPSREEFRGTGGSVYFLERQDLTIGSERLRVEVRDKVSGLVIESRNLRPQEDYDVDYIQGRILLTDPLQSTVRDNQIVRNGSLPGNEVYLVVRYEYTPGLTEVNGYTLGGRATHWLGNKLRIGATAQKEETGFADQNLLGADILLQQSTGTYLKAEFAQTKGPGFARASSSDGGFNFNNFATEGQAGVTADAYRLEAALNLGEISGLEGRIGGYFGHQDDGFSGSGRIISGDVDRWGIQADTAISERTNFTLKYDEVESQLRGRSRAIYGDVSQAIGEHFDVALGLRHDDADIASLGASPAVDGSRTDLSAQLGYDISEKFDAFIFGQLTVDQDSTRQSNDRAGLGGSYKFNDRLTLGGEVSDGDGGLGANANLSLKRTDNSEIYLGYALSADRNDTGRLTQSNTLNDYGTLTFGGRTRFNDSLSVYGEERLGFGQHQTAMTHAYGVDFSPAEKWNLGASIENGRIEDDFDGTFKRTAFTVSAARAGENLRFATNLEGRFEDGISSGTSRDRTTWLMRNTASIDAAEDWEVLGRFNFAMSDSDQSDFLDADFIEGVAGLAYRPIDNDRLNALFKYTYFEDLAPVAQISPGETQAIPRQRSQVLSVDAIYDLTKRFSIGGKYGFRSGEVAFDRVNDDFIKSDAHIGIVRVDYHVVDEWDILAEGRLLVSELANDERVGALIGAYKHVSEKAKIGVGYNFAKFSDDLTDFNDDNDGFFINMVGKF